MSSSYKKNTKKEFEKRRKNEKEGRSAWVGLYRSLPGVCTEGCWPGRNKHQSQKVGQKRSEVTVINTQPRSNNKQRSGKTGSNRTDDWSIDSSRSTLRHSIATEAVSVRSEFQSLATGVATAGEIYCIYNHAFV